MLVKDRMSPDPISVSPETTVPEALRLMRERKVRRLLVVDSHGQLAGIVSDKDLLHASPSPATSLSVWEIPDLIAKIKTKHVMTREVVTVTEDTPLEEAARIMADRKIGGLPVLRGETPVGIITETDLFKVLLELLGGRRPGVRLTVSIPGTKGTLAKASAAIAAAGGNVVGLGINEVAGTGGAQWEVMFKVQDAPRDTLVEAVRPVVTEVLSVTE